MDYKKYSDLISPQIPPNCEPQSCKKEKLGSKVELYNEKKFRVGDIAKFRCRYTRQCPVSPPPACWRRSGYMMTGSPVSWCGSDGSWSPAWALVSCSRSCSYPGATIHGTINPVHFYYSPGQTVTYTCSEVSPWSPGHHRHLLCPGLPAGGQACAHVRRGGRLGRGAAQVCRQESLNMVSPQTSG